MADWGSWQCWIQIVGFFLIFIGTLWIFIIDHPWWTNWYDFGRTTPKHTTTLFPTSTTTFTTTTTTTTTSEGLFERMMEGLATTLQNHGQIKEIYDGDGDSRQFELEVTEPLQ